MSDLFFDTPLWLVAALIVAGVVLWLSGNKRSVDQMKHAGLAIAAAGVLLCVLSYLVDTDVEKVTKRSRQLVQSVVDQDWPKMRSLLDEKVVLRVNTVVGPRYNGREEVVEGARRGVESVGLQSAWVTSVAVEQKSALLTSSIRVYTDTNKLAGQQVPSDWEFDWESSDQGWVVNEIRLVRIGNITGEDAKSQLPK